MSFEVCPYDAYKFGGSLPAITVGLLVRVDDVLANMILDEFNHQAVHRAPH